MNIQRSKRLTAASLLAALSVVLSGCFIMPGKFTSELVLKQGNEFAFTYDGEIHFLGLSKLAQMSSAAETFEAKCYDEDSFSRECSQREVEEQRADWNADAQDRALQAEKQAQQMAAMMGGIDPNDPDAAFKLEQLLLRHKGWNEVIHLGDGKFDVDYAIEGEMSHDMMFPVIEGFARNTIFVEAIVRKDGVVRVNAPGFAPPTESSMMGSMMGGMAGLSGLAMLGQDGMSEAMPDTPPGFPVVDGTFSVVTDGQILANNTDEGASAEGADGSMQRLSWDINPQRKSAPTALVKLAP